MAVILGVWAVKRTLLPFDVVLILVSFLFGSVGGVVGVVVWLGWCFLLMFLTCFFSFGGFDQERTNKAKPMENDDGNERDRRLIDDSSRRHRRIKSRGNMRSLFFIH